MENDEKLQKVKNDTSDEVQNKTELIEKEEEKEVAEEPAPSQAPDLEPEVMLDEANDSTSEDEEVAEETTSIQAEVPEEETEIKEGITSGHEEQVVDNEEEEIPAVSEAPVDTPDENQLTEEKVEEEPNVIPESENEAVESSVTEETDEAESEEEDHEEEFDFDFENAEKKDLLAILKEVKNEDSIKKLDKVLKGAKPRFDELFEFAKNEALQKFVSDGNEADAFEYHGEEVDKEFITLHGQLRAKRNKHFKDLNDQKEDNLKRKERLLATLREIVDGEESVKSIDSVKEIQSEWKKIGPVPGVQNNDLWANYNALLDRYYDNRSIYFELKDLDRKKNLTLKQELCVKAESLGQLDDLKSAIVQLNDLHEEYKHIGPVPKEDQEPLWQRFKAASDAVYAKRKEYFDGLKVEFAENLVKKEELIKEVEEFLQFNSDRITEWNDKTKEILELQKKWEVIGGVPKEKAKATNRAFWNSFKKFFSNKNQFFKELESKREENLIKKQELIAKAEELKESDQWDSSAQKFKNLQSEWKDIGPVPEKLRKETYAKFKEACDHFFNRRRDQNKEKFKEYDENLNLKQQICDQIQALADEEQVDLDSAYDLIDNYTSIGFVPKNAIRKIARRFEEAVEKLLSNEAIEEGDRSDLRNHLEVGRLRNTPGGNRKIQRKENSIRRKISTLENDISTWNTNMEFFANSATADKLKAEMQEKVEAAEKELTELKYQLKSIQ